MPGLIAVLGDRTPEATVRRAAEPLLRRPGQSLELLASPADGVALGFVGSHGGLARDPASGLLVALDGELVLDDAMISGGEAARRLAERYADPQAPAEPPDGEFAACVWDPRGRTLRLVADRLSHRPIYVARRGGSTLVASELKAFVAAGLTPELDLAAAADLLTYEFLLGERTLLDGVRLVPPGSTLTLRAGGGESLETWWSYRLEPEDTESESALVEEFARLLRQSVRRRVGPDTALALSGGVDSRAIASVLGDEAPDTLTASYGAPGSEDLVLGARVARAAGLRHLALPLERGYLARGAAETVWLTEGHIRCLHAHHLVLRGLRERSGVGAVLIGFLGDGLVRGGNIPVPEGGEPALAAQLGAMLTVVPPEVVAELLAPGFGASLAGVAQASFAELLTKEQGTAVARRRQFIWRHETRRKIVPGALLFADDLAARDPFADSDLIEFCRRLPDWARVGGHLERAYLRRHPRLARIRSPKEGVAPGLRGRREALALRLVHERRALRALADRRLGPRWSAGRSGIGDYATDLRLAGADLLGILLEPRTLARGQVREAAVRTLVDDALSGRRRHTKELGLLLTLELFQRQFIDGDGFPGGRADAPGELDRLDVPAASG